MVCRPLSSHCYGESYHPCFSCLSCSDSEAVARVPNREKVEQLWAALKVWQAVINEEAEYFVGDALLQGQEKVKSVTKLVRVN